MVGNGIIVACLGTITVPMSGNGQTLYKSLQLARWQTFDCSFARATDIQPVLNRSWCHARSTSCQSKLEPGCQGAGPCDHQEPKSSEKKKLRLMQVVVVALSFLCAITKTALVEYSLPAITPVV